MRNIFQVFATDKASEQFKSNATVVIELENENDNSPVFEKPSYKFIIPEDTNVGETIGHVKVFFSLCPKLRYRDS